MLDRFRSFMDGVSDSIKMIIFYSVLSLLIGFIAGVLHVPG